MESITWSAIGARSARPPTPVRTPIARPAPAARAISRSAGESPTTAVRAGATPTRRTEPQDHVRGRLDRDAVVGADDRVDRAGQPERGERPFGRGRGRRSSRSRPAARRPGARRTGPADPPAAGPGRPGPGRARPRSSARSASRVGHALRRRGRRGSVRAVAPSGSPRVRRRAARRRSPGRSRASRRAARRTDRPIAVRSASAMATAQPLHIEPNSMSVPSLSKMTRSMPSSRTVTPSRRRPRTPRCCPRDAPSTKHASRGNETVTSAPTVGHHQVRLVERVERDARRRLAVGAVVEVDPDAHDRAEEVDVVDGAAAAGSSPRTPRRAEIPSGRRARVTRSPARGAGDRPVGPDLLAGDRHATRGRRR